jgi:hypothetical protein
MERRLFVMNASVGTLKHVKQMSQMPYVWLLVEKNRGGVVAIVD